MKYLLLPGTLFLVFWLDSHDFSFPGLLCTSCDCVCYLGQAGRGQREKSNRIYFHSWIHGTSGQREAFSFLQVLGICSATVYHFCATVVLPTPKGFPSIFLTHERLFSCSSDKKERAYLGALSVCIYYKLLNFRLPLSSGWETLYFKKREIQPQFRILRVCLSSPVYLLHTSSPSVSAAFRGRDAFSLVLETQRVLLCP